LAGEVDWRILYWSYVCRHHDPLRNRFHRD